MLNWEIKWCFVCFPESVSWQSLSPLFWRKFLNFGPLWLKFKLQQEHDTTSQDSRDMRCMRGNIKYSIGWKKVYHDCKTLTATPLTARITPRERRWVESQRVTLFGNCQLSTLFPKWIDSGIDSFYNSFQATLLKITLIISLQLRLIWHIFFEIDVMLPKFYVLQLFIKESVLLK